MASSRASSSSPTGSATTNPFADAAPPTIAAASIYHVNIRSHVPVLLDYDESNYSIWSAFYDATFLKFGLLDHIDGTVDAQLMWQYT